MSENMWNDVSKPEVDALLRLQNTASADSEPAGTLDSLRAELDAERAARAKAEADAAAMKEVVAKWVYVTITGHRYLSDDHGEVLKTVEESNAGAALLERLATAEAERDAEKVRGDGYRSTVGHCEMRIGELQDERDALKARVEALEAALQPFAIWWDEVVSQPTNTYMRPNEDWPSHEEIKTAADALKGEA